MRPQRRPEWLTAVLAELEAPRTVADGPMRVGDIRKLASMAGDQTRLVAVLSVDWLSGQATVALASNEYLLASDQDLILRPQETGLAYPLMVELDVAGPVSLETLGERVARLPFAAPALLRAAMYDEFEGLRGYRRGLPIQGEADPRWAWKLEEMHELEARMASQGSAVSLEDRPSTVCLDPAVVAAGPARLGRVLTFVAALHPHLSTDLQRELGAQLRQFSPDVVRSIQPLLQVRPGAPLAPGPGAWDGPHRNGPASLWAEVAVAAAHGHRSVAIATDRRYWESPTGRLPAAGSLPVGGASVHVRLFDVLEACNG